MKAYKLKQSLSVADLEVAKYAALKDERDRLTSQIDELSERFKHRGSFSTRNYHVIVDRKRRVVTPNIEDGIALFGKAFKDACKSIRVTYVKVIRRGKL